MCQKVVQKDNRDKNKIICHGARKGLKRSWKKWFIAHSSWFYPQVLIIGSFPKATDCAFRQQDKDLCFDIKIKNDHPWMGQLCSDLHMPPCLQSELLLAGCTHWKGHWHGSDFPHDRKPVLDWWAARNFGEVTWCANSSKWWQQGVGRTDDRSLKVGRLVNPFGWSLLTHFLPGHRWHCDSCFPSWHSFCQLLPLSLSRFDQFQGWWAQHLHSVLPVSSMP